MFRIIYRQRRRILLTASLCTMSILVGLTTLNPLSSATPAHELVLTFGIFLTEHDAYLLLSERPDLQDERPMVTVFLECPAR